MYQYISTPNSQELEQFGEIDCQCFAYPLSEWQPYLNRIGRENFRVIADQGRVIGGLAIYNMGQWFDSKTVSMAGIAAVGVAPEYRGQGVANQLLKQTIQELYSKQIPISVLYPATQIPYRKVGYEQGGSSCRWKLPTANIELKERTLAMNLIEDRDSKRHIFEDIYRQQARLNNGNLDRNEAIWQTVLELPEKGKLYAYLIGSPTKPEGYVIFTQEQERISIRDWALLTAAAAKRVWTFLGDHRSQIKEVTWWGSPVNHFLLLLPEQSGIVEKQSNWMLRIIDLPIALTQRGYPPELSAQLHLEIKDDLLPANNGKFCLRVFQGKGEIERGGNGDFQLNICHFASLYAGFLNPIQLKQLNYLQATPAALATASLLFLSGRPWMPDFF
ncbi:MAG: GNAT family N-acetyltransferase [Cyanobacteria bacterium P01_A01_bin.83]